jgi:hypothetical protein
MLPVNGVASHVFVTPYRVPAFPVGCDKRASANAGTPIESPIDSVLYWAFSFNGEPQAQAKSGNDACDLLLID